MLIIVNRFHVITLCFVFLSLAVTAQETPPQAPLEISATEKKESESLLLDAEALLSNLLPESSNPVTVTTKPACNCQNEPKAADGAVPIPESLNAPTPVFGKRYDWIRLTSDEWLKGDLLSMYEEELEFDSDELGILTLDWEDIAEIHSKGLQSIRLIDGSIMEGWIAMKNGVMAITTEGESYEFDSLSVMTIASSQTNRRDLWDGDVSLGVNVTKGNTDTLDYTFTAGIQRRTASNRFKASYVANFSENTVKEGSEEVGETVITADSKRFTAIYDFFYTDNIFIRAADYEFFSDSFQNVDARHTIGVAIGYPIIKEKKLQWDVTAGPGYQKTTFSNVEADANDHEKSSVITLSTLLDYEITKQVELIADYQVQLVDDDSGKALHQLKFGLELDLVDDFDIDLTTYLNRTAKPRADENGNTPEKNDYRFVVSLGYSF